MPPFAINNYKCRKSIWIWLVYTKFNKTSVSFIPTDGNLDLGITALPKICVTTEVAPYQLIEIKWLKDGEIYCTDTISVFCEPSCGYLLDDSVSCVQGNWQFSSSIKNMSGHGVNLIDITFDDPLLSGYNQSFSTGVIPPFGIYSPLNFTIGAPAMAGDTICFTVTLHDESEQGNHLSCCTFNYCVVLPACAADLDCLCEPDFYDHVASGITCTPDVPNPGLYTFQLTDHFYFQECDFVIWYFADGSSVSATGGAAITHPYSSKVCAKVHRLDDNGVQCGTKTCKSLLNNSVSHFLIYPNPSSGKFNILSKAQIEEDMMVEIRDLNNRPVFRKEIVKYSDIEFDIDIAGLSSGLYYIHFITSENHWVEKISKQ